MDQLLITFIACMITAMVSHFIFYYRTEQGEMTVHWNDKDKCWDARISVSSDIDYTKKYKLILKIKQK